MDTTIRRNYTSEIVPFFLAYLLPASVILSVVLRGYWWWATFVLGFILIPIADEIWGHESFESENDELRRSSNGFNLALWLYVPIQVTLIFGGIIYASGSNLAYWEKIVFMLNIGISSGALGFTVGHELGHRKDKLSTWLCMLLYHSMNSLHFRDEHNKGHHVLVATPEDPATSSLNQSFYSFLPQTMLGSYLSAYGLEKMRLKKQPTIPKLLKNKIHWYLLIQLVTFSALYYLVGLDGVIFYALVGFLTNSMLEVINYIEHYGLIRQKKANGRYESVKPHHSWNANQKVSNLFLFRLQRHSDHHANASRPYQILRHYENVPQLPYGYPTMVLMALVPPLWKFVMNPKVQKARENFGM